MRSGTLGKHRPRSMLISSSDIPNPHRRVGLCACNRLPQPRACDTSPPFHSLAPVVVAGCGLKPVQSSPVYCCPMLLTLTIASMQLSMWTIWTTHTPRQMTPTETAMPAAARMATSSCGMQRPRQQSQVRPACNRAVAQSAALFCSIVSSRHPSRHPSPCFEGLGNLCTLLPLQTSSRVASHPDLLLLQT